MRTSCCIIDICVDITRNTKYGAGVNNDTPYVRWRFRTLVEHTLPGCNVEISKHTFRGCGKKNSIPTNGQIRNITLFALIREDNRMLSKMNRRKRLNNYYLRYFIMWFIAGVSHKLTLLAVHKPSPLVI